MKPSYLSLESLDDRREIWHLLHRMPPAARLSYLYKCCEAVKDGLGNGLFPLPSMKQMVRDAEHCERGNERLTNAVWTDALQLCANRGLCLAAVALDLEQVAKGRAGCPAAQLKAVSRKLVGGSAR